LTDQPANVPANRNTLIAELYRQGEKLEGIGARFGITRQRVLQIAKAEGQILRGHAPPKPQFQRMGRLGNVDLEARNVVILSLYEFGFRPLHICGITGLTRGKVQGVLDRFAPLRWPRGHFEAEAAGDRP
jgi:hypothetical protein